MGGSAPVAWARSAPTRTLAWRRSRVPVDPLPANQPRSAKSARLTWIKLLSGSQVHHCSMAIDEHRSRGAPMASKRRRRLRLFAALLCVTMLALVLRPCCEYFVTPAVADELAADDGHVHGLGAGHTHGTTPDEAASGTSDQGTPSPFCPDDPVSLTSAESTDHTLSPPPRPVSGPFAIAGISMEGSRLGRAPAHRVSLPIPPPRRASLAITLQRFLL